MHSHCDFRDGAGGERLMAAIMQRFTKTRLGWRVTTQRADEGMGTGPGLFAFTRKSADRKARRAVRRLLATPADDFTVYCDGLGQRVPAPLTSAAPQGDESRSAAPSREQPHPIDA